MSNIVKRAHVGATVGLGGLIAGLLVPSGAFAQATADADTVAAVTSATGTLTETIKDAIPLILGVTIVLVVLGLGKKLVKKAG